jgi:hypothetical protein
VLRKGGHKCGCHVQASASCMLGSKRSTRVLCEGHNALPRLLTVVSEGIVVENQCTLQCQHCSSGASLDVQLHCMCGPPTRMEGYVVVAEGACIQRGGVLHACIAPAMHTWNMPDNDSQRSLKMMGWIDGSATDECMQRPTQEPGRLQAVPHLPTHDGDISAPFHLGAGIAGSMCCCNTWCNDWFGHVEAGAGVP